MSDTEHPRPPLPSREWLDAHVKRLREQADAADELRRQEAAQADAAQLNDIAEYARRQVEIFATLPCLGTVDRVDDCSERFSAQCERRSSPSCPREIVAFDRRRHVEEFRQALEGYSLESHEVNALIALGLGPRDALGCLRLIASGVPFDALLTLFCGKFRPTQATVEVDEFLADESQRTLVLSGDVGVGKSVGAAYAIRRRQGVFMTARQIGESGRFGEEGAELAKLAYGSPLLVIDDLGIEYTDGKGWFLSIIEPLLVDRHNRARRTVVTCNVGVDDFAKRYGVRIADRIAGSGRFVELIGESLRGAQP